VSYEVGLDPVELRVRNHMRDGDEYVGWGMATETQPPFD
jgi:hypothetical protein